MALGGGTFLTQNKILPGSYINFVSASKASATLSERGVATLPIALDWGPAGEVFTVENGDFQKNSLKIFGHAYTDDEMLPMREIFINAKSVHFYNLNTGGAKASNTYATAKYPGSLGNSLQIVIQQNEAYEESVNELYDVSTYLGTELMDTQSVTAFSDLESNDFVVWKAGASLTATAGTPLTGGSDGEVSNAAYQTYLDKIESYSYNTMGCATDNDTIKALFASFNKRMRDEQGVKCQLVLHRYAKADYEGVISVENGLTDNADATTAIYWVTGAQAGCNVNKSLTNATYSGELLIDTDYTQTQLENAIKAGKFIFHSVNDVVRVLTDINTFISVTDDKSSDFSSNQTIRVLDQIGNDIAVLFNTKYLGKVPNDNSGRISLWNDIVKHHTELQGIRAIENFSSDNVVVEAGDTKKSVVVTDYVTPVNAMEQLYMQVIVQ
jgi:hypothetical protein